MSNPNQEIIESRLASYVDGELEDAGERLAIEQHLQQNPQYRKVLDELSRQRDMLRGLPREAAPAELADQLNGQMERSVLLDDGPSDRDRRMRMPVFSRLVAAAAILLLTSGLAMIVYYVLPGRESRSVALATGKPVVIPPAIKDLNETADKSVDESPDSDAAVPSPSPVPAPAVAAANPPEAPAVPGALAMANDHDAANRELAEKDRTRKSAEQLQFSARRMDQARADELSHGAGPHDAELDELVKNVSQDGQVRNMLAGATDKGQVIAGPASSNDAVVMVVSGANAQQVQQQLGRYVAAAKVVLQPAPRGIELALNTSLSRQNGDGVQDGASPNTRKIEPDSVESAKDLAEAEKDDKRSEPTRPVANNPAQALGSAAPSPVASGPQGAAKRALDAKGAKPEAQMKAVAGTPPTAANSGFAYRGRTSGDQSTEHSQSTLAASATPTYSLYVVRHLARGQVKELNEYLARGGEVRQSSFALPAEPSDIAPAPTPGNALADNISRNGAPAAPTESIEKMRVAGQNQMRGGALAGGSPAAAPAPAVPNALRNIQESGAVKQESAAKGSAADKPADALAERRQQAAAPGGEDAISAGNSSPAKPQPAFGAGATTQPGGATDDAGSLVDVVIVIQNNSPAAAGLVAEPSLPATATTTPVPATRPTVAIPPVSAPAK